MREDGRETEFLGPNEIIGNHREQAVEEHLASDEYGIVALVGCNDEYRVCCPAEARHEGQRIANGRQVKHEMAVHDHEHQSTHSKQHAHQRGGREALALVEQDGQQRGKQRTGADNERGIGGGGIVQRLVLSEKIQRTTSHTQRHHQQLVTLATAEPAMARSQQRESQQQHVGNDEAKGKNLRRRQALQ